VLQLPEPHARVLRAVKPLIIIGQIVQLTFQAETLNLFYGFVQVAEQRRGVSVISEKFLDLLD
jgi:hypothetical protein